MHLEKPSIEQLRNRTSHLYQRWKAFPNQSFCWVVTPLPLSMLHHSRKLATMQVFDAPECRLHLLQLAPLRCSKC